MSYERIAQTDIALLALASAAPAGGGGTATVVKVGPSDFTTTSLTLVNIAGLTFAALANSAYLFEARMKAGSSDGSGIKFGCNFSAALSTYSSYLFGATNAQAAGQYSNNVYNDLSIAFCATASPFAGIVSIRGQLTTGANPGNFTIMVAKVSAGTATIYAGSPLTVEPLIYP